MKLIGTALLGAAFVGTSLALPLPDCPYYGGGGGGGGGFPPTPPPVFDLGNPITAGTGSVSSGGTGVNVRGGAVGGGGGGGSTPAPPSSGPSTPAPSAPAPAPSGPAPSTAPPSAPAPSAPVPGAAAPATPRTHTAAASTPRMISFAADTTTWDLWWRYNAEQYLRFEHARTAPVTRGDGAGLAAGAYTPRGVHVPTLKKHAVPELVTVLENETDVPLLSSAMLALARIGQEAAGEDVQLASLFMPFLTDGNRELSESAAIALGALADDRTAPLLAGLLRDDDSGRRACSRSEVPPRLRAFAAYGLGLVGASTERLEVQRFVVHVLERELEQRNRIDVGAACAIAAGLVALPLPEEDRPASASRLTQLEFLAEVVEDDDQHDVVRAHAVTSIGRLLDGVRGADRDEYHGKLLDLIARWSKADSRVQQSAVLALGTLADADGDRLDRKTRETLKQVVAKGNQQARRFATIALAEIGGRAGQGDSPHAATDDVRAFLLNQLVRGKSTLRSWAALSLGVLGERLAADGQPLSAEVSKVLRKELKEEANPERAGAYAVALGLRGETGADADLLFGLDRHNITRTRGHFALGLGMAGVVPARTMLREVMQDAGHRDMLMHDAALALALTRDAEVQEVLEGTLADAPCSHVSANAARAIGRVGDTGSVEPLVEVLANTSGSRGARIAAAQALGFLGEKEALPWNAKIARGTNYLANPASLTGGDGPGVLSGL